MVKKQKKSGESDSDDASMNTPHQEVYSREQPSGERWSKSTTDSDASSIKEYGPIFQVTADVHCERTTYSKENEKSCDVEEQEMSENGEGESHKAGEVLESGEISETEGAKLDLGQAGQEVARTGSVDAPCQQQSSATHESKGDSGSETESKDEFEEAKVFVHPVKATFVKRTQKPNETDNAEGRKFSDEDEKGQSHKPEQVLESEKNFGTGGVKPKVPRRQYLTDDINKIKKIRSNTRTQSRLPGKGNLETEEVKIKNLSQAAVNDEIIAQTGKDYLRNVKYVRFERGQLIGTAAKVRTLPERISRPRSLVLALLTQLELPRGLNFFLRRDWICFMEMCLTQLRKRWDDIEDRWKTSICRKQLTESPLNYVGAIVLCVVCLTLAVVVNNDWKDVPICITLVTIACCVTTLSCRRGCLIDYIWYRSDRGNAEEELGEILSAEHEVIHFEKQSLCECFCCHREKYKTVGKQKRWYRNRRKKLEANTKFKHEVVDVPKLRAGDYPKMKNEVEDSSETPNSSSGTGTSTETTTEEEGPRNTSVFANAVIVLEGAIAYADMKVAMDKAAAARKLIAQQFEQDGDDFICELCGKSDACKCAAGLARKELECESTTTSDQSEYVSVSRCQNCGASGACNCLELTEYYVTDSSETPTSSSGTGTNTETTTTEEGAPQSFFPKPKFVTAGECDAIAYSEMRALMDQDAGKGDLFLCEICGKYAACACAEFVLARKEQLETDGSSSSQSEGVGASRCQSCGGSGGDCNCLELGQEPKFRFKSTYPLSLTEEAFTCRNCGQGGACACPGLFEREESNIADTSRRVIEELFKCQFCGQCGACACPSFVEKEKLEFTYDIPKYPTNICLFCGRSHIDCICFS